MIQERYLSFGQQKRYKFILVGDSNVGKTALFWRFTQGDFLAEKQTQVTTIDFKIKDIQIKQKPVRLYIWDTAGQQKYRSIVSTYFKGCHGVLLVFDVTREQSFENAISQWYDIIKVKAENAVMVLVGNKNDLQKRVAQQKINDWCKKHKIRYMATSVKQNSNVDETFMTLAKMVDQKDNKPVKSQSFALNGNIQKNDKNKSCC